MHINCLAVFLAMTPAPSGAQGATQPSNPLLSFLPMVLLVVVFYFLLIRPQQQQAKKLAKLVESIKPGDKVGTSSGLIGVIISVKDKTVTLRSGDAKLEVTKVSVTEVLETGSTSEA